MNNARSIKRCAVSAMASVLALGMLLSTVGSAVAQEKGLVAASNATTARSEPQGPSDPAEMEAFLDALFAQDLEQYHVAGAAVAVVKDGKLFFSKGYGYADVERKIPVDAAQTIFATGSVGKAFTWTALMQLVEQGKLDLDADINTYLDFRIPATFPQPITLKNLLTHTAGFEDKLIGSAVTDAKDLIPPRQWLVAHMPMRLYPPGEIAGYTNYSAMLAGYIVGRVSGQPYPEYLRAHIFEPLGMAHSTVESPMPQALQAQASVGYTYAEGAFHPFPDFIAQPAGLPSGMHHVTVTDMARFMIAHLENGRYSDATIPEARILEEATAQQMKTTLYTPDPRLKGTAYGFFDLSDNGQWTLGSSGYLPPMHSILLLLPDQRLGVFAVYNSQEADPLTLQHSGFQKAFFDHYYPAPAITSVRPPADFAARAGRFTGAYRVASSPHTSLIKIIELFGGYRAAVTSPGDGTLALDVMGLDKRFVEVEPLYFRQVDGPFAMVFREDDRGRITRMDTDLMPQYGAVKLQWYETTSFHIALALGCVLVFLSMILVAAIRSVRNRRPGGGRNPEAPATRIANWIALAISILNLIFLVGIALWGEPVTELHGISLNAKIVLGLGVVSAALTAGALVYMVLAWKDRYWGVAARAYYTLVTLAAIAFVWFLNYWNLLGWRY